MNAGDKTRHWNFLFLFFLLLCSSIGPGLPTRCTIKNENLLDCSKLNEFPNGSFHQIQTINFSENNFTELTRNVFQNHGFDHVKVAILRYSNIKVIQPRAFYSMANLLHLDLSGNHIEKLTKSTFTGLAPLQQLNLASNHIAAIAAEIFEPLTYLDTLDVSNNSITALPRDLLSHGYVTQFDLSENPLVLPNGPVLDSSSLVRLSLRACGLEKLPLEAFRYLPELQHLDLAKNKLREIEKYLLEPLVGLKVLDISHNLIAHLDSGAFAPLRNLLELDCKGNALPDDQTCDGFVATTARHTNVPIPNKALEELQGQSTKHVSRLNDTNGDIVNDIINSEVSLLIAVLAVGLLIVILLLVIYCVYMRKIER